MRRRRTTINVLASQVADIDLLANRDHRPKSQVLEDILRYALPYIKMNGFDKFREALK